MTPHRWKMHQGEIDEFALDVEDEVGGHNGPMCKVCGFSFCVHCAEIAREDLYDPELNPCLGPAADPRENFINIR